MIRTLKSKDLINFIHYSSQRDKYSDFYITKDNKRLFLTDLKISKKVFSNCMKCGDKCLIYEENNDIKGILLLTGFADKFHRKYLKIFAHKEIIISNLIKALNWHYNCNLYIKVKKFNPITEILLGTKNYNSCFQTNLNVNRFKGFGFKFKGSRGKEVLLSRQYDPKFTYEKKKVNNESRQYGN